MDEANGRVQHTLVSRTPFFYTDDQHGLVSSVEINVSLAQAKGATETQKRDGQYEGRELSEVDILVWRTID